MKAAKLIVFAVLLAIVAGCPAKKEGSVEGVITPSNANARITALQNNTSIATVEMSPADGRFTLPLPPGTYDIRITAPSLPLPVTFPAVVVETGRVTTLPAVDLSAPQGTTVLSGRIAEPVTNATVILVSNGKERAAAPADTLGGYRFTALPAGHYTLRVNAPGYAPDVVEIILTDSQTAVQNVRLLYMTPVKGVDWTTGVIRATGKGLPPKNAPNATIRKEMAKRAALADGQRNLVRVIDQIRVTPESTVKDFLGEKAYTRTIQGFVQGYRVTAEKEREDGAVELELELPVSGAGGLSSLMRER